jgi:DNA-binding NarL/FixJ family response regulator
MDPKRPIHIFIVENNRIFVQLLDYVFSKSIFYRFLDFRSGEDCLRSLHLHPEIVVLDYRLNGMNGYETLQEIKEQNPDVYVIMLIGESDGKLPAEMLNAGADDYVLKDGSEVVKIIEKIEARLSFDPLKSKSAVPHKPWLRKKLYYALLLLLLASVGVYYYQ